MHSTAGSPVNKSTKMIEINLAADPTEPFPLVIAIILRNVVLNYLPDSPFDISASHVQDYVQY